MPRYQSQEIKERLARLEALNPEFNIIEINELIASYISQHDGEEYTPEKAEHYKAKLEQEFLRQKAKAEKNKSALVAVSKPASRQKPAGPGAIENSITAKKNQAVAAAAASGNPALAVGIQAAHTVGGGIVKGAKAIGNTAVHLATETDLRKTGARVVSAAAAVAVGGLAAGAVTTGMANGGRAFVRGAISNAFKDVNDGFLGFATRPVTEAIGNGLGGVAGAVIGVVLPIALLYLAVPRLYNLFFYGFKLGINAWDNRHSAVDLSILPEEGPLLDLIGHLSTLSMIEELDTKLKLKGIANIKFNISNLFQKIMHPGSSPTLSQEEEALYQLAQRNAKKMIEISKKATNDPEKLRKYQNYSTTRSLIKIVETHLPSDFDKNREISKQMRFCLTVIGTLIQKEQTSDIQQSFLSALKSALAAPRTNLSYAASTHSEHIYETIPENTPAVYQNGTPAARAEFQPPASFANSGHAFIGGRKSAQSQANHARTPLYSDTESQTTTSSSRRHLVN
ncbi:hypothetical protein [Rickettsiella massiliensis]|uniref:hypothetical protein n=1 Tax=Rickettsiella massiliensis TaxID=676517 RepID=UPI00029A1D9C|nr:hypothetical protein [Rickettsiella massiliensis]